MKNNTANRVISIMLMMFIVIELTLSSSIGIVYGISNNDASGNAPEHFISEDNVKEVGENYTVFEQPDGSETIQVYTGNVRKEDENGELTDIDNSLEQVKEDGEISYTNVNGFVDITLPETLASETPIKVENGADSIKFMPAFGSAYIPEEGEDGENNNEEDSNNPDADSFEYYEEIETEDIIEIEGTEELASNEVIEEEVPDLYGGKEEKQTGIKYETPDDDVFIEYLPIDSGVKENIILEDIPDTNVFSFIIKAKGQYLEKQQRGIVFKDINTDKVKGTIQEPFMTDSSETEDQGYSEDLEYSISTIDEDKGIFQVDLTVGREYLEDKNRVYPVYIDPTYTANTKDKLRDAYVLSKHSGTNYYSNGVTQMCIGYGSKDGVCRTYIQFPNLQSQISGAYINSAKLSVKERNNTKPYATLAIYRVAKSWNLSKITYKNQPGFSGAAVATKALAGGTKTHSLNVTSLVQGWASGTYANYGMLLKATSEKSSTRNFSSLYGSRVGTASYRPKLEINYVKPSPAKPSKPTVRVNNTYIKKGAANITASWSNLNSNILNTAQIQLGGVFGYRNVGGSSYNIDTKNLAEGKYTIYVRGVDKLGKAGDAGTATFTVDGTGPEKPKSVIIESARQDELENAELVKITVSVTPSADLPAGKASGVKTNTVYLIDAETNEAFANGDTTNNSITFEKIDPKHRKVYARVKTKDYVGNESEEFFSEPVDIKNVALPNFAAAESFESNLNSNPWRSKAKTYTTVSWNADYNGSLGRITAEILKEDNSSVGDKFAAKEVLKDKSFPKKASNYRLDKLFDLKELEDGKYKVVFSFYPESEMQEEKPVAKKMELPLYIDNVAPVFTKLEQSDPEAAPRYIFPDTDEPLTGVMQLSYGVTDAGGDLGKNEMLLIGPGTHKILTESEQVFSLNTTEYDDGKYTVRVTQEDRAGNSASVEREYIISNPPPTPKVILGESYGGSDTAIEIRYSYPVGDESKTKVVGLQAALTEKGKDPQDVEYVNLAVDDPSNDGTATYVPSDVSDGEYELCVRSIDSNGTYGKVRRAKYVVDDTDPIIEIKSPRDEGEYLGFIKVTGSISDSYLRSYNIAVAEGETTRNEAFETVYSFDNPKDINIVDELLGIVDISDNEKYPSGTAATIRVDAMDKNGNHETAYRTVIKKEFIEHPSDFEIQKDSNDALIVTEQNRKFSLIKDNVEYTAENPRWFVDGTSVSADTNGNLDFSDLSKYPDDSIHSISVYDKTEEGNILYGVPTMEYTVFSEKDIQGADYEYVYEKNIKIDEDVFSIHINADENLPNGTGATYYIANEKGEYVQIDKDRDIIVAEEPVNLDTSTSKNTSLRIVLKKNDAEDTPRLNNLSLTARVMKPDTVRIGLMDKYNPLSVTEIPQLNYKVKLSWEMPDDIEKEGLTYEIYRSTDENFSDANTVLVQEGIENTSWYDNYTLIDKENNANNHEGSTAKAGKIKDADFYYKVVAVKSFGDDVRKSNGTEGSGVMLPAMNEYTKRLGEKDYWGYSDIDIGAGDAKVEESTGNFVYSETDAYVKGKVLDLSMERTYNSMSTGMSALGYSWDFAFNPVLLETYDSYGDNTGVLFKDGSGTIYTFLSIKNDEGVLKINKEGTSDVEKIETHFRSPLGTYIHLKKTEILDADDADQDGDKEEVNDVRYTIETLSNDIYTFNRNSQIESFRDSNSNEINYKYDEQGRLVEVENPAGNKAKITFSYFDANDDKNARELIRYITLPNGQIVKYEYTDKKMLKSVKLYGNGEGSKLNIDDTADLSPAIETSYSYTMSLLESKIPLMTGITDPNGNESRLSLETGASARGRCNSAEYPNGDRAEFEYIKADNETKLYDETIESYYVKKILTSSKIGEARYRYNADGNIIWEEDIEGSITETEYMLGLEVSASGDVDIYDITDAGIIQHSTEKVANETTYDAIADTNTLASKIGSTKGNVRRENDSAGNVTKYAYSQNEPANAENPTSVRTDSADGEDMNESFSYDSRGNLLEARDDDTGEVVKYEYDASGQVVKETYIGTNGSATDSTSYIYDNQGNVVYETSTNGSSPASDDRYKYDDFGRLVAEIDANGYLTTHNYDALDREICTKYYTEKVATGTFSSPGDALSETKEYDKNGNLLSETDREGRTISYSYDNMDRVTKKTITKGDFSKTWTYRHSIEDVNLEFESGNKTVSNASVTRVINPDGNETSITVKDKVDNIVKTVENGISTYYKYSRDGEITEMYSVGVANGNSGETLGLTILANYDKFGNNTSNIVNPAWNGENFYVSDDTQVYKYTYDSLGNIINRIDPKGNTVKHKYDSNARVTHTITSAGTDNPNAEAIATVKYDIQTDSGNNVCKITNAMGQYTETETDPSGNTLRITDIGHGHPNGRRIETNFEYDALGNLIKEENANGVKTYSYDSMNNMIESVAVTNTGEYSATEKSIYSYDRFGAMTSRKDYKGDSLTGEARFKYDSLKRLSKYYSGGPIASGEEPDWIEYEYDIEDNLTSIRYPEFMNIYKVSYEYDSYNRVTAVKMRTDGIDKDSLVREYSYRSDNRVSSVKDYSSDHQYVTRNFDYDDLGRCIYIDARSKGDVFLELFKYTYDNCNNIISEEMMHAAGRETSAAEDGGDESEDPDPEDAATDHISADGSYHLRRDYTYNELSELTLALEFTINEGSEELLHTTEYTYDKIGSRTSEIIDGVKNLYTYDEDGLNQLTKVSVEGDSSDSKTKYYSYDDAGNLINLKDNENGTETSYTYNVNGELVSADVKSAKTGESVITENRYDGSNMRIAKTVVKMKSDGDLITGDTTNYLVSGNNLLGTYITGEANPDNLTITSENVFGVDGKIILTVRGNKRYIYTTDLRGSTASIINDAGVSSCVYYYDIYGEPETLKIEDLYNEIMYTGAVCDESTGLLYLSARYYDAQNGRFISQDSYRGEINNPLSLNLYGYCNGNPVNQVDEDGHSPHIVVAALVGAATSAAIDIAVQSATSGSINWKQVCVSAATGAIDGALISIGVNSKALDFAMGAIGNLAYQVASGEKIDYVSCVESGVANLAICKALPDAMDGINRKNGGKLFEKIKKATSKKYQPAHVIKNANKAIKSAKKNAKRAYKTNRSNIKGIHVSKYGYKSIKKKAKRTIQKAVGTRKMLRKAKKIYKNSVRKATSGHRKTIRKHVTIKSTIGNLLSRAGSWYLKKCRTSNRTSRNSWRTMR